METNNKNNLPAVSVIIPLYNAEKYIGECLDSLLAQTLKNFEVIVVDDCSTDLSAAIVQSYAEKFDGRLTFTALKKNSGNAGYSARNKGFTFSRGEYVFFVDADDFIKDTALEELYTLAKNFDADVVYTGSRYHYTTEKNAKWTTDRIGRELKKRNLVENKPTLTINDPNKNLQELLIKADLYWTPWTKFVKRNFLTDKEISFYEILSGGDFIWTIELFASAERFLRVPNAVYFWRNDSEKSITRNKRSVDKQISFWSEACIYIAHTVFDLSKKIDVLKNPLYQFSALKLHLNFCFKKNFDARVQVQPSKVFDILRREFESKGEQDLIIPFLFSIIDLQQKSFIIQNQQLQKFSRKDC